MHVDISICSDMPHNQLILHTVALPITECDYWFANVFMPALNIGIGVEGFSLLRRTAHGHLSGIFKLSEKYIQVVSRHFCVWRTSEQAG